MLGFWLWEKSENLAALSPTPMAVFSWGYAAAVQPSGSHGFWAQNSSVSPARPWSIAFVT